MADVLAFSRDHPQVLFLFGLGWTVLIAFLAARRRIEHGLPVRPVVPPDALFAETWTSGSSKRSLIARLGGAKNCLLVAVTNDAFVMHPHFPFNLFVGGILSLDRTIPRNRIRRVTEASGIFGRTIHLEFDGPEGAETVELRLRDPRRFLEAMQRPDNALPPGTKERWHKPAKCLRSGG